MDDVMPEGVDIDNNSQQRTPCVLVLDASGSMAGEPIERLNKGVKKLENCLKEDEIALSRVQIAIVEVGGGEPTLHSDWADAVNFDAEPMEVSGLTPLGEGLEMALDKIEEIKELLRKEGIGLTRPWMIVITDGAPTDSESTWQMAVERCKSAVEDKKVSIFPIGVLGADMDKLGEITPGVPPLKLSEVKFEELFVWLSDSLGAASRSRPGQTVELASTDPWRHVGM